MPLDLEKIEVPVAIRAVLTRLAGHVTFDRFDEKGANGYTFFGVNTLMDRKIVVKFYYWGGERETFAEPERLAQLNCPAVLPIYDAAPVDDEWAYFSAQFCEKGDVDHYLAAKRIPLKKAIDAALQVLSGVSYLHSNGFVHRDLKPSNIFVNADDNFLIGDFGSVRKLSDGWAPNHSAHSRLYRPPETFYEPRYHCTGDIYQVGILLYQLLGGCLPYEESAYLSARQLREYNSILDAVQRQVYANSILDERIQRSKIMDFNSLPPWVPSQLKAIIKRATRPLIADRYQLASEMSVALGRCRTNVLAWEFVDGMPVLNGATQFRIVETGGVFSVEKRRSGPWKTVREASEITLAEAVHYVERR